MKNGQKTVFVGLSGGVDSSVAALRLIQSGYNVVGVFIKVWHPDFLVCNWEKERLDAMRVAAKLDIPFLTCDAETTYKDDVAAYFIDEYKKGRTPNPDVMCNKYVKFGTFLSFAQERGADYIATGHYAQNIPRTVGESTQHALHRGMDVNKDQTYFLWTLTQEQLSHTLFPVGNSPKAQIRKEAEAAGLHTANKKDSQGICFLGDIDIPEFLSHYIDLEKGVVLDEEGNKIGTHKGSFVYTLGQRHGFTITTNDPTRAVLYVSSIDIQENTITVSSRKPVVHEGKEITLEACNFINEMPQKGNQILLQTRYRQQPLSAIISQASATSALITLTEEHPGAMSRGQSCVLYDETRCIGGGIIT